jgi:hypothetical protein
MTKSTVGLALVQAVLFGGFAQAGSLGFIQVTDASTSAVLGDIL